MISISKISSLVILAVCICLPVFVGAQAQVTQTLTVSPTLFDMKASPGQVWQSEIRIVNVNNYDILVYPQVVNFAPLDESGRGNLIPVFASETKGQTLAEWVTVPSEPVVIERQQTASISVLITVPEDAAPGGHYAAILIGTKPPSDEDRLSQVQTAQFVTSLLFVRIAGDVIESGDIREFRTTTKIVQSPEVGLSMRFENKGNVHLQPQGEIQIYNMWGSQRGVIPINQQTHFGNVLPQSIREFMFTWEGDTTVFDLGRYQAIATLGYGDESKQFVTSTAYFWVIPYTILGITLVTIIAIIWLVTWFVRRYVERMLALQTGGATALAYVPIHQRTASNVQSTVVVGKYGTITEPVRVGVKEFKYNLLTSTSFLAKIKAALTFVVLYRLFFIACAVVLAVIITIVYIVSGVNRDKTAYEITIGNPGTSLSLTSEEVAYNKAKAASTATTTLHTTEFELHIINISGETGIAAAARLELEKAGYLTKSMTADTQRRENQTVVVYDPAFAEAALIMSQVLDGALLSASTELEHRGTITIYAGSDIAVPVQE